VEIIKSILLIVSALFPIVNPLGGSPVYLALTAGYTESDRLLLARKVAVNSLILLLASFLVGAHVLAFFGISIPVVQVGGGIIVVANGWALLQRKDEPDRSPSMQRRANRADLFRNAFYPLTLPLTVGPGSISVALTLGANEPREFRASVLAIVAAVVGIVLIAVSIYLCYGFADRLAAVIGENGMSIVLRLSAFLLVCIGVQIVWNGLSALVRVLLRG
jgi:multiple antibiotic resistance protein